MMLTATLTLLLLGVVTPDTCGQDRRKLANWFIKHGGPEDLEEPAPYYVGPVLDNPYDNPDYPPQDPHPEGVCGVKWTEDVDEVSGDKKYLLRNFTNLAECEAEGFVVTHAGHCGSCSYLQDLGVYLKQNLTEPVRTCGALGIVSHTLMRNCLIRLGFSMPCISIWEFNILQTRQQCWSLCILSWVSGEPNNKPDGSLNDCLQCDEDKAGPNFKFFSGRTRRNSGIRSAIERPPEEFYDMDHCYWYGDLEE